MYSVLTCIQVQIFALLRLERVTKKHISEEVLEGECNVLMLSIHDHESGQSGGGEAPGHCCRDHEIALCCAIVPHELRNQLHH